MAGSLSSLPSDIVEIIAKYLPPYDVLHLGSTCKPLRPIFHDKSVWLQVSDAVSYSRPLPYTANEALSLTVSDLHHACLRAERVAKKWAEPEIQPSKRPPVRICFPDRRVVSYFSFIPGFRHIMVYDVCNVLSCWTVEGKCFAKLKVFGRAVLTRWRPLEEFERAHWGLQKNQRAIEITVESPRQPNLPTRCDFILLVYSSDEARFTPIYSFTVPAPFEPFSSLSMDEIYGALVILSSGGVGLISDHVGIYLTDRNTKRAICLDTGLSPEAIPQALVSSQYMVLYWETRRGAHTYMYDTNTLRTALNVRGLAQDDPQLDTPFHLAPCEVREMPFITVAGPSYKQKQRDRESRSDTEGEPDDVGLAEETQADDNTLNITNDWGDWYPVIIPKWSTLREDLRRHRTRSIMTFSRSPSHLIHDLFEEQDWIDLDEHFPPALNANNGGLAPPNVQGNANGPLQHNGITLQQGQQLTAFLQNMQAIPHMQQGLDDLVANAHPDLHDVLAMFLPMPQQTLQLPAGPAAGAEGVAVAGANGTAAVDGGGAQAAWAGQHLPLEADNPGLDAHDALAPPPNGLEYTFDPNVTYLPPPPLTTIAHHYFEYDSFPRSSTLRRTLIAEVPLRRPQNIRMFRGTGVMTPVNVEPRDDDAPFIATLNEDVVGADAMDEVHDITINGNMDLRDEVIFGALDSFVQDPFGGSPVMGYGGRCAMWVEEHEKESKSGESRSRPMPVVKAATFPPFEKTVGGEAEGRSVFVHPELEVAKGKVCTLVVPDCVDLDRAYSFDLDDMRGVVGMATSLGEIWLIDYS